MRRAALTAMLALTLSGAVAPADAREVTPAERGHAVARRACAACHAVEAGGNSPMPRAPAFGSAEMAHVAGLEGRVASLTSGGHYGMPPVRLTPQEVSDLVAYIEGFKR